MTKKKRLPWLESKRGGTPKAHPLQAILGDDNVVMGRAGRAAYSAAAMGDAQAQDAALPALVVRPGSAEEVAAVVTHCAQHNLNIVPRGAGTSWVAGAAPDEADVVIALSRLTRIDAVDEASLTISAEAGARLADIDAAAARHGLRLACDPATRATATLGGALANQAGGPGSLNDGGLGDQVIAVNAVLADGRLVTLGDGELDAAGLDLIGLLAGSEGHLGIVTQAQLKLCARPPGQAVLFAALPSLERAVKAAQAVLGSALQPSMMMYADRASLRALERHQSAGWPQNAACAIAFIFDGAPAQLEAQIEALKSLLRPLHATITLPGAVSSSPMDPGGDGDRARSEAGEAPSDGGAQTLWHSWASAYRAFHDEGSVCFFETNVPLGALDDVVEQAKDICRAAGGQLAVMAHLGDGTLHGYVRYREEDLSVAVAVSEAVDQIVALAIEAGGAISGEHGIGRRHRNAMHKQFSPAELDLMRAIKHAFDADGRLNRDKVLPPSRAKTARAGVGLARP
ncbi:MAG: FAD-binding oxidoreductase [Pseudomonadota bacterium]